jgi:prohibitin 2
MRSSARAAWKKIITAVMLMGALGGACKCHTVEPGSRGVRVDWGVVKETSLPPGFTLAGPGSEIFDVSTRQQKQELKAPCFSSDLQEVNIDVAVLFRIPEANVVKIFTEFHGEPFDVLVAPRVQESIKEATSTRSAEQIVKQREAVKIEALATIRKKVGDTLVVEDIVISDIGLSGQLKAAIEAKMVQEQEAAKAKYTNQKAEADAETARSTAKGEADAVLLRAKADAESIRIRGEALRQNPGVIQLELIQKWNGQSPTMVAGSGGGVNILMPAAAK